MDGEARPPIPPLLQLLYQVRTFQALPKAGGLLDQPAGLMQRLTLIEKVNNAYLVKPERKPGKWGEWDKKHPGAWEVIKWVEGLRNG